MSQLEQERAKILAAALHKLYPATKAATIADKLAAQKIASNQGTKLNNG